jgi:ArsR family metal-binding transcriptional regulator
MGYFINVFHPTSHYKINQNSFLLNYYCTMLHLFDDLWLDKMIPRNNDEGRAIYGNLENKINTLYSPVENSIPKNNDRSRL